MSWSAPRLLLLSSLLLAAVGCGDDPPAAVCEAGMVRECPCVGGAQGAQTCAADGSQWEACVCPATDGGVADAPGALDSSAADAAADACVSDCSEVGATTCDGAVIMTCQDSGGGCLTLVAGTDCSATTGMTCDDVEGTATCVPLAYCSVSGTPCLKSVGCDPVQITGFCVERDDVAGYSKCAYDARFDGNGTVTCEGEDAAKCLTSYDCPGDAFCNKLATNWCGGTVLADGLCTRGSGLACVSDDNCTITPTNECLACGDGTLDAPQEACDDGNTLDTDLCSSRCQPIGFCFSQSHVQLSTRCSKVADCDYEPECTLDPCTCEPAP